uniref:NADH dehydrogenase subunit 2 n=1 Tax=Cocconeiopsis kantsiensis TaxID=3082010 RepID=UPI0030021E3E
MLVTKNLTLGLPELITLKSFSLFSEYFLCISIIYVLIVIVLITYNVYGLMLQKAVSECLFLTSVMASYLVFNDDLASSNLTTFNNSIMSDNLSYFSKIVICLFSAIYFLIISTFLKSQKLTSFEYLLIVLFSVLGLLLMCSSNDLLIAYLAIELSSLALYILASFKKTSNYSLDSGIKYFITGAVSSSFFLLGCAFIYGSIGSINFTDFSFFVSREPTVRYDFFDLLFYLLNTSLNHFVIFRELLYKEFIIFHVYTANVSVGLDVLNYTLIEVGLMFILFGLFIKLALAPFHLWSLDVYEGSPTSSTVFFAVLTKLSIFVLLIRLCYRAFPDFSDYWQFCCVWVSMFSVFVGSFGGLTQRKLKTLLAYSSTSHMGYVLLAFSTINAHGLQMASFYIVIYMLASLCSWYIVLLLELKRKIETKYTKELSDFSNLKKSNPALAFSFAVTMFSMAGIPPLIGFFTKMTIFLSLIKANFFFVSLMVILCSVVSTFYYIRIIKVLYFENTLVGKLYNPIKTNKTVILSVLILLTIFLLLNPTLFYLINSKIFSAMFYSGW